MSSIRPTEHGNDKMLVGSDPTVATGTTCNTLKSKVSRNDDPLIGKYLRASSNLNSNGAVTPNTNILFLGKLPFTFHE